MYELATKMKTSLEAAVNRRNVLYALEAVQFALSLLGGVFSFMGAKPKKQKTTKRTMSFGQFGAINSGVQAVSIRKVFC